MCRSRLENGRRCPCDTAAARQDRRLRSRAKSTVSEVLPELEQHSTIELVSPSNPEKGTKEAIQANLEAYADFQKALPLIETLSFHESGVTRKGLDENNNITYTKVSDEEASQARAELDGILAKHEGDSDFDEFKDEHGSLKHGARRDVQEKIVTKIGESIADYAAVNGIPEDPESLNAEIDRRLEDNEEYQSTLKQALKDKEDYKAHALLLKEIDLSEVSEQEFSDQDKYPIEAFVTRDKIHTLVKLAEEDKDDADIDSVAKLVDIRTVYDIMQWRLRHWRNKLENGEYPESKELYDQINKVYQNHEAYGSMSVRASSLQKSYSELNRTREVASNQILDDRGKFYRKALEEVAGVKFSKGDITTSDDTAKNMKASVALAVQNFPQNWVEVSNRSATENAELRVKDSKSRAHYSERKRQKKYNVEVKKRRWLFDSEEKFREQYERTSPRERGEWDISSLKKTNDWGTGFEVMRTSYSYAERPYSYSWGTNCSQEVDEKGEYTQVVKPSGNGWQEHEWVEDHDGKRIKSWRRPRKTRVEDFSKARATAEITSNAKVVLGVEDRDKHHKILTHELSHRFEDVVPEIARIESAFISRRAKLGTDEAEKLTSIYEGSKVERGYKDSFTNHYVGKTYDGRFFEVMSTGMESIFAGSFGGLIGAKRSTPDPDHRNFVLGVLASVRSDRFDK